jgi:hypothetical protein
MIDIKRKLVVFKFTLSRGYAWCQLPTMALMGAGILYPYTKGYFPWLKLWALAIVALAIFVFVGWLDRHFRLLHEEQNYGTQNNPTLMAGLFPEKAKETEKYLKAEEQYNMEKSQRKENKNVI